MYTPSDRVYEIAPEPEYSFNEITIRVTNCGRICIGRRKINPSSAFAGQTIGITEVSDKVWLVSFMQFDLGYFDEDDNKIQPTVNPFTSKVLPMSSV